MDIFSQLLVEINDKQQRVERECCLLRTLLKPWPFKKTAHDEIKEKSDEGGTKTSGLKNENSLSAEEKRALMQLEQILEKAEKVRKVKQSKNEMNRKDPESARVSVDTTEENNSANISNVSVENLTPTGQEASIHNDLGRKKPHKEVSNKPDVRKDLPNVKERDNRSDSALRSAELSSRSLSSVSTKSMNSARKSSAGSLNGVRYPGRPASGRNRHVPAHMSAPFKTDPNLKTFKKDSNPAPMPRRPNRIEKHNSTSRWKSETYKTLPSIQKSPLNTSPQPADTQNEEQLPNSFKEKLLADSFDNFPETEKRRRKENNELPLHKESDPVETVEKLSLEDGARGVGEESKSDTDVFLLRKNGSALKLPGKLTKLVSANNSLRDRCLASQLVKKVSSSDSAQKFVDRLESQWEVDQELFFRVRAIGCLRSHHLLLETLENLNLDHISESASFEDIYKAKKTLEFVLSYFASLQDESDLLSTVQFRKLQFNKALNQAYHDQKVNTEYDALVENFLESNKEWLHLEFMKRNLQAQLSIMHFISNDWQRYLKAGKSDPYVLQALFGLLTSSGQFLPAFVENV